MKRILVSLLIALPISVVVTAVLLFASAMYSILIPVCFPYAELINDIGVRNGINNQNSSINTIWINAGLSALFLQFPVYAIVIAIANGWRRGLLVSSALVLIVHSIAALCSALTMYRWW
jgi:hypothetical protein